MNLKTVISFVFLFAAGSFVAQSDEESFSLQKGFSPNNDGKNDSLTVSGNGIKKYSVKIYNNRGEQIAELDEKKVKSWDGKFKNVAQPAGVYVWRATIEFQSGKTIIKSGDVSIIR